MSKGQGSEVELGSEVGQGSAGHGSEVAAANLLTIRGCPYTVSVLKEGYSYQDECGRSRADGTVTLVRGPLVVLVDTGAPGDEEEIVRALGGQGLRPRDVQWVVCTHGHSDHAGNLGLFPHATFVVSHDISRHDLYLSHDFSSGAPYRLDEWLEVVGTAGHCGRDVSLLVRGTTLGTVAVVGDLFEREDDQDSWPQLSENPEVQAVSRKRVWALADVIVPGHGPPFMVNRSQGPDPCSH